MKKTIIVLLFMALTCGCGQRYVLDAEAPPAAPGGTRVSGNTVVPVGSKGFKPPRFTVANLPTYAASDEGALVQVTDGADAEDTTVGGGSSTVLARWTGSAWANAGDGQAAGSAEVQDQVFNAANFDGGTADGMSQDDFYDLWHGVDTDDDGSFADEAWLTTYLTGAELTSTLGAAYDTEAELNALFAAEQDALTFGIADTNSVVIDQGVGAADDELVRFTASGIEGMSYAELAAVAGFESALEAVLDLSDLQGAVTDAQVPDTITIDNATLATTVTVSDDEATNDAHEVVFTTDNATMESDGDLNYNPSTGVLSATGINAELEGATLDIANTTAETGIAADDLVIIYDVTAAANRSMTRGNFVTGIGAGQAIILDLEDDGGNDSVDLGEIAPVGAAATTIFNEVSADKLEIDTDIAWPSATVSVTSTITDNEATVETNAIIFTAGGDLDGGNIGLESDGDLTYNPSTGTLSSTILTSTDSIIIGSADIEEAELEILDGATATTAELNILDGVTSTFTELNILDGATASYTDLNIIDGVSDSGTLTAAELLYVDGVTSAIQTQLDARCLESVFGTAIEADDLTLNGTTLELVAEIPHLDVAETVTANWDFTANPHADDEVSDTLTVGNAGTVDPDAMSGDTSDDDLIDQDVIEGFAGSTDPYVTLRDTDAIGAAEADEEAGRIYANMITTTEDAEDSDMWFTIMQGGARTTVLLFDESDDQWETTKNFLVPTEVYDATNWNGDMTVPTKDAVRDKIEGLAGTGTMTTVTDGGTPVGGPDIVTLDFDGTVFGITESPDTEINIDIADDGLDSQHYAGASVDPEHVSIGAWDFGTSVEGDTLTEGGVAVHNNDEMDASSELLAIIDDETGSGAGTPLIVFNQNPTLDDVTIGSAGVKISDDGDGAITLLGLGDGSDEDLTINLDDTANTVVLSSSTGVTEIDAGSFQMVTTGDIMGGVNISSKTAATYTVGTDDASESYGTLFLNGDNDAITFTLPSAVAGMSACFYQGQGASAAVTVTPASGDYLVSDGVRGTVATAYASSGAAGDKLCVIAADATDWYISSESGTWSE